MNLNQTLQKFAKNDLALARKHGLVCIAQTKLGALEVRYVNKRYDVRAMLNGAWIGANLTAKEAAELIAFNYEVVAA